MGKLRVLGVPDLCGRDGLDLRPILLQPKRLALLTYLALGAPRAFQSRDTLLAMFWPELDNDRARASLRKALHFLRARLGKDVIVNRGREQVRLAEGVLWCDAVAFDEAYRKGRHAEGLALYQGDFLSGFHVQDAPEFERWLDAKRSQLRLMACTAALALAESETAAGNATGALFWAKRAELIMPENEEVVRRLLVLLDQAGDRVTALRKYAQFERWLEEEYGVAPMPETKRLVEDVRRRSRMVRTPVAPDTRMRKRADDAQAASALKDRTTGLPNRRAFQLLTDARLRLARRMGTSSLLIRIEIQNLAEIGTQAGRPAAEQLLGVVGKALRETFRESDIVGRIAEREFAALATQAREDHLEPLAERLRERVRAQTRVLDLPVPVALRIGAVRHDAG